MHSGAAMPARLLLACLATALVAGRARADDVDAAVPLPAELSTSTSASRPVDDVAIDLALTGTFQRMGALLDANAHYRRRLYASDDAAFSDNFVGVSFVNQVAPIFVNSGVQLEVAPASFVRVYGGYQPVGYFGALGTLRTRSGCKGASALAAVDQTCDYSPVLPDDGGVSGLGHRLWGELVLQAALGRFTAFGSARVERWWMHAANADGADTFWVNELYGIPQAFADVAFSSTGAVLFEVLSETAGRPQLLVGAIDDVKWAAAADVLSHRVGPIAIVHLAKWRGLRDLNAALFAQFYTHERYLVGQFPLVGLSLGLSTANFVGAPR